MTEGEFDCLSSIQAHLSNTVAIKGSALTKEQVSLLARSVTKLILALDRDEAGIQATKRAIEITQSSNLEIRVVNFNS